MPTITNDSPVSFSDPLPDAVDVAVIGAGIVGTATAYFLAKHGLRVALCEKGRVAGEQSSRNWGWVRQQGRDPVELPIMIEANRIWRGLAEETGEADLAFKMCGCLYVAGNRATQAQHEQWHEVAGRHQLDTRLLNREQVAEMVGPLGGDCIGGMLTPSDGYAEPWVAVPVLARAARRLGTAVIENCAVRTVETQGGAVNAVVTEHGRIRADAVLLAGGAWSTYFAGNLGLDLPQLMVRSTVGRTHPVEPRALPNVSAPGLSIRARADRGYTVTTGDIVEHFIVPRSFKYFTKFLKMMGVAAKDLRVKLGQPHDYPGGWRAPRRWSGDQPSPFERMRVLNPAPSVTVQRRVAKRLPTLAPWLAAAGMAEYWAGMIDVTPDAVPYICAAPAPEGLFIGTGLSGHGFGIGPGIGRVLADLIRGHAHGHDLSRFRFERFSDGSPIVPGPY